MVYATCRGQRSNCDNKHSLSNIWVHDIELGGTGTNLMLTSRSLYKNILNSNCLLFTTNKIIL